MQPVRALGVIVMIAILAFALGVRGLRLDLIFVDEYWSMANSGAFTDEVTLGTIWERTADVDPGGMLVLYHWLLGGWMALAGKTLWAARLYSVLWGVVALALTYRLARDLEGRRVGLYAACFLASSAFFLDFFHEVRAYTQFAALTVAAVWAYVRLLRAERWIWSWASLLFLALVALHYTHYVALSVVGILGLWHIFHYRPTRLWWSILTLFVLSLLSFAPWVVVTLGLIEFAGFDANRQITSMSSPQIISEWLRALSNEQVVLALGLALLTLRAQTARLAWLWIVVGLILIMLVNAALPFVVHSRYTTYMLPAGALLLGLGLARLPLDERFKPWALALWLGFGVFCAFTPSYMTRFFGHVYRAPADGMAQAQPILRQWATQDDALIFHIVEPDFGPFGLIPVDFYIQGVAHRSAQQFELMNLAWQRDEATYGPAILEGLADAPFVWTLVVPEIPTSNKSDQVQRILNERYVLCDTLVDHPHMVMRFYADAIRDGLAETDFIVPKGRLTARLLQATIRDGQARVVLGWQSEGDVPVGQYAFSVQALNASGGLTAQHDEGLPDSRPLGCSDAVLPALDVRSQLVVYDWRTGQRLLTRDGLDGWSLPTVR
ncbi:MAG: glycosyltransferase family 39 protein [Anaerolineae bacterium]|nr:glycosyltransferase family 39 protein [Anaerolineae bacterium]MDW8173341.1 glycosyltransferase family 39 protein [Anaerolineae bacterium]